MPNEEIKLRPCPFCGGTVDLYWWDSFHQNEKRFEPCDEEGGWVSPYVKCVYCDMTAVFDTLNNTSREVAEAWNRREKDAE